MVPDARVEIYVNRARESTDTVYAVTIIVVR